VTRSKASTRPAQKGFNGLSARAILGKFIVESFVHFLKNTLNFFFSGGYRIWGYDSYPDFGQEGGGPTVVLDILLGV
jgi:hypothetical protein